MARTNQKSSSKLSRKLDNIGYSREKVWKRIHTWQRWATNHQTDTFDFLEEKEGVVYVGSQVEGVGFPFLNDMDVNRIVYNVLCSETARSDLNLDGNTIYLNENDSGKTYQNRNTATAAKKHPHKGKLLFKLETENSPAGYCFLKLVSKGLATKHYHDMEQCLIERSGDEYLSSELFLARNERRLNKQLRHNAHKSTYRIFLNGPSVTEQIQCKCFTNLWMRSNNIEQIEIDWVTALPCQADSLLKKWKERDRQYSWPSLKTIAHVTKLPAYVTPVGQKGSKDMDLQWRIVFTMAEIRLLHTFNSTQMKVYVLLKLTAKHVLKKYCPAITSYVVKNVLLWLAEKIPHKKFRQKHLLSRLRDALEFLQESLITRVLPSYMIPQRNLFSGKLSTTDREMAIEQLIQLKDNMADIFLAFLNQQNTSCESINNLFSSLYTASILDHVMTGNISAIVTEKYERCFLIVFSFTICVCIVAFQSLHMNGYKTT